MTREQPVVSNARWWRHDSCRCTLSVSTRRPASVALARLLPLFVTYRVA